MKGSASARRKVSGLNEARIWRDRYDALLNVVNAILLAKGDGPQHRLGIANVFYEGQRQRQVAVEALGDRIVVYLEPVKEEAP